MFNERVLASRYRSIGSLGKGAFGKIYLARDTLLPGQPKCVVKQLYPHIENGDYLDIARRLFKKEAETLHKLGHWDKIPTLYAYFEEDKEFYLVQQYIPGNPLSLELTPGNIWSEAQVVRSIAEVLHILNFIHSQSVIHRDIKPSNLIRRQGDKKLVLVDFGAVKEVIISQTNIKSNLTIGIGTKGYMSPEQIRGKPRFNSDIYALGIIAIQALTGMNPNEFVEDEDGEIIWQDRVNANPKLIEIVSKMTRYHFQERYQSAKEVLQALEWEFEEFLNFEYRAEFLANFPAIEPVTSCNELEIQNSTVTINNPRDRLQKKCLNLNKSSQLFLWKQENRKYLIPIFLILLLLFALPIKYIINYDSLQKKKWLDRSLERVSLTGVEKEPYRQCLARNYVEKIQKEKGGLKEKEEILASCKLDIAEELAANKNYIRALEITLEIEKNGFYNEREIQKKIDRFSAEIVALATEIYQQEGDLEKASKLLDKIPKNATLKLQTSDLITQWSIETDISKNLLEQAKKSIEAKKWRQAKNRAGEILKISKSQKWQGQANNIIIISTEEIAKELLEQARAAIAQKNWQEAKRIAGKIKQNSPEKYLEAAEQIIETASQEIELESGNNKPVFGCDRGLNCTQLY